MIRQSSLLPLVATLDPVTVVNSEVFTDVIDMSKYGDVTAYLQIGNVAAETVDFRVATCLANGSSATTLKACTQLAAHASNNDGVQLVINVTADEVGAASKQYIKFGVVTGSSSGGPMAITVIGSYPRYGTASSNDLSSVGQIKI